MLLKAHSRFGKKKVSERVTHTLLIIVLFMFLINNTSYIYYEIHIEHLKTETYQVL